MRNDQFTLFLLKLSVPQRTVTSVSYLSHYDQDLTHQLAYKGPQKCVFNKTKNKEKRKKVGREERKKSKMEKKKDFNLKKVFYRVLNVT